ncbi:hypothetical protein [Moorena sp. SIO4G3]|nr:hypothetical protein [Moorena sp. SIO4G3]
MHQTNFKADHWFDKHCPPYIYSTEHDIIPTPDSLKQKKSVKFG